MSDTKTNTLTEMVAVYYTVTLWTGKIRFDEADYEFLNSGISVNLPKRDQGSLGNKKVVDPDVLKPFQKLKDALSSKLRDMGLPFVGGVLVPAKCAGEVRTLLQETENEFKKMVSDFVANYPNHLSEWERRNPELDYSGVPDALDVGRRFAFSYHLYKLSAVQELGEEETQRVLETSIRSTFYDEIVKKAKSFYGGFIYSRPYGVPEFTKGVAKFRAKLMGLAFLNAEVKKFVDLLDEHVIKYIDDKTNQLKGEAWINTAAIFRMISNHNDLNRFLNSQVVYTDFLNEVEPAIRKAQKIFEDLRHMNLKGKQITPALVYKICMGEIPMPTGTVAVPKRKATSKPKVVPPKDTTPTLPLIEPAPVVNVATTVTAPPPKADLSPMDILNGMFG